MSSDKRQNKTLNEMIREEVENYLV